LQFVLQKLLCNSRRFVDVIAANAQRSINSRRIVEDKSFRCGRRAVGIEDCNLGFEEARSQFAGICDGRGAANELRLASVKTRDAAQPAKDIAQMAAENAAVGVQFVENDVPQILDRKSTRLNSSHVAIS